MANEDHLNPDHPNGKNNGPLYEPENDFLYNDIGTEEYVLKGRSNHYIVFGRDRMGPTGEKTGYGSLGEKKCASIDIVAGRMSATDASTLVETMPDGKTRKIPVNSNVTLDAARIYISQKSDIDDMFKIPTGISNVKQKAKSAIAIKADEVRLIARGTIKLVSKADTYYANPDKNGKKVSVLENLGVQLMAGGDANRATMQPIPKGDNLKNFLISTLLYIKKINGTLLSYVRSQSAVNYALMNHDHISMYPGTPCSPSSQALRDILDYSIKEITNIEPDLIKHTANLTAIEAKFLSPHSAKYINSSYHYLN